VLLVLLLSLIASSLLAQYKTTIPLHKDVKHGVLQNGMNYFVLHNEEPKDRASFYFVQNVGAILEEDDQNGLAHFLEHMAFNGTKNFAGKGIINSLENHGVTFGQDINAYTALDETVYNLSRVPVDHPGLIDSCLLVLHDWSGFLSLKAEEIDAERGVIREEWRTRRNSQFRLMKQTSTATFANSKYGKRDVIGDLDLINNFEYTSLRNYYKKWYRPDLQAVVVVGDVNADEIESKIKALFSEIPLQAHSAERIYYPIPNSKEMLFCKATDREASNLAINLIVKMDVSYQKDEAYMRTQMMRSLYSSILNSRFQEFSRKEESANAGMWTGFFPMGRIKEAMYLSCSPKEKRSKEAFEEMITEVERLKRFGFTKSELDRAKVQALRSFESYLQQKDKISNDAWAKQLGDYFLEAEPLLSPEDNIELSRHLLQTIGLEDMNKWCQNLLPKQNLILTLTGPEKDDIDYPEKEELQAILNGISDKNIEEYDDHFSEEALLSGDFKSVDIVSEDGLGGLKNAKSYKLSNGVTVALMPTDYNQDQILFSAYSYGGMSLLNRGDLASAETMGSLLSVSGLGDFDASQLKKKLAGKLANVSPYLSEYTEGFSGSASSDDFETLLQLLYLRFEKPHFDKEAYNNMIERWKTSLPNMVADNDKAFGDTISYMTTNYHARTLVFDEQFLNEADFDKTVAVYKDRFANAADFKFVFVGNIDTTTALPLIQKYLGSLAGGNAEEQFVNHEIKPAKGVSSRVFKRQMEIPKSTVYIGMFGELNYVLKNRIKIGVLAELLNKRYLESIREEEGGSYGVGVSPSISRIPEEEWGLSISFDCDPEKLDKLKAIVYDEIKQLVKKGPIASDLLKIKENLLKSRIESEENNYFWLSAVLNAMQTQVDFIDRTGYEAAVNSIDDKEMQAFARKIFGKKNVVEVIMNPENYDRFISIKKGRFSNDE